MLDGHIWVVGGLTTSGEAAADVVRYDPAADAWSDGPALPRPVHHAGVAGDGERLWVVGGYTDHDEPTDDVWTLRDGTWQEGPRLPEPRAAGGLAWDGERLVYAGGVGPNGLTGDVYVLAGQRETTPPERPGSGQEWELIGRLGAPREHLAAASDGRGTTWFLAGRTGGLDTNLADVDLVSGGQVRRIGEVPTARGGVAGFHLPELGGCVVGGEGTDGTFDQVECITADGTTNSLPPLEQRRHGLGAAVVDGVVYAMLGGPTPGLSVTDAVEALVIR